MNDSNFLKENGVNLESALEYLGDMETYNETLKEFLDLVNGKLNDLNNFKNNNDMPNYAISVHSLKSDARYLGFTALAELALNHEMQSKEGNIAYVNENFNSLITEANKMIGLAKSYLGVTEDTPSPAPTPVVTIQEPTENAVSILVVDDSDIVRNFISRVFNNTFNVILAGDGEQAINALSTDNNIKCILLDLNMPGVNGFAVLDYLKENALFTKYPVSIITGADDKETITEAFTYPIIDMLQKPFNEKDVKRIIERTMTYGR
jgi:CheY-like chemotaxis protein/HPt (histidine-containing phosphotransfer) domain-containing protein